MSCTKKSQSKTTTHKKLDSAPLWMADAASPVILKELWAEVHKNYDKIKKYKLTGEIDKEKYMLVKVVYED